MLKALRSLFICASLCAFLSAQESLDPETALHLGKTLAAAGRHTEALEQYSQVLHGIGDSVVRAETGLAAARSQYALGRFEEARASIDTALALESYPALAARGGSFRLLSGLDERYAPWSTVETDNICFHFEDSVQESDRALWARQGQEEFTRLNEFFACELPVRIQYWVWGGREGQAEAGIPEAGYLDPALFLVQSRMSQNRRHELAHMLSYHASAAMPPVLGNTFIWEGLATRFEDSGDPLARAREVYDDRNAYRGVLARLWQGGSFDDSSLYPIAGAWVDYLIRRKGRTKFLRLLADQSWAGARKLYGWELPFLVNAFEAKLLKK